MDDLSRSTSFSSQDTRSSAVVTPDAPLGEAQKLRRLQHWRACIEADGFQTMLSVVSPCGLIVRDKRVAERWLVLAPDRSLVMFQRDSAGRVRTQQLVVEALGIDSDAASGLVASAMVRRFLQPQRA